MATSYANTGGTGNRTAFITCTNTIALGSGAPSITNFVDGVYASNTTDGLWFSNQAVAGLWCKFDLTAMAAGTTCIDEAKWYQDNLQAQGIWKWQGSNDNTNWTDIGSSFTVAATNPQTQTQLSSNTLAWLYYRLIGVSGNASSFPWIHEIEFKIGTPNITASNIRVAQSATLLLTQDMSPVRVAQSATLLLVREPKKRVLTLADTRN